MRPSRRGDLHKNSTAMHCSCPCRPAIPQYPDEGTSPVDASRWLVCALEISLAMLLFTFWGLQLVPLGRGRGIVIGARHQWARRPVSVLRPDIIGAFLAWRSGFRLTSALAPARATSQTCGRRDPDEGHIHAKDCIAEGHGIGPARDLPLG
jgi:hypothetical protein